MRLRTSGSEYSLQIARPKVYVEVEDSQEGAPNRDDIATTANQSPQFNLAEPSRGIAFGSLHHRTSQFTHTLFN